MHTYIDLHMGTHLHTSIHTHMFTHEQKYTHSHMHRYTKHTHVQTCTHTNTYNPRHSQFSLHKSQFSYRGGHSVRLTPPLQVHLRDPIFSALSMAEAELVFWDKEEETQKTHTFQGLHSLWFPGG